MARTFTNIHTAEWTEGLDRRGERWKSIDLSGEHLGVRIEELPPGGASSVHHFHTLEEEHVIMLEGSAVLVLGDEEHALGAGDHVWFAAGKAQPHHLENRSQQSVRLLVFGERVAGDTVFYPEHRVMLVKSAGDRLFTYRDYRLPGKGEAAMPADSD